MLPFCTDLYAETYRAALANKPWAARSLIDSAQREGERGRRLWSLAARAAGLAEVMAAMLQEELAASAETAAVIERRSGDEPLSDFAERFRQRVRGFIDLTSEEPVDRGYHLRFGHYP